MTPAKEEAPRANVGPATDNEKPTPMAEGASADALSWDDTIGHDSTPAQDKLENTLRQCPPPGGGVHAWILSCANIARIAGVSEAGAEGRIAAAMTRPPKSNELRDAIRKAYDSPNAPAAPPAPKVAVSLFDAVTDTRGRPEPLRAILDGIRAGKWRALVEAVRAAPGPAKDAAKKALPGFTPAGVFTARNKSGLAVHSGCVVVDLDNLPGPEEAAKVRDALAHDPATVAAFISPSGCGVKALVAVETCADAAEHEAAYAEIAKDYAKRHGLNLDTSGKDVSRLCFVSHDPGAFIRPGAAAPFAWKPRPQFAPYSTRSWGELARMELPPPRPIWGGIMLGALGVFFGQGGLGKSRVALNIARNQVLGLPFAGLPVSASPLRHCIMGSENSIHRLQSDVRRMSAALDAAEVALLDSHIRLATLEAPEDPFISVSSPENVERWRVTLSAWPPDVLWIDPWGDVLDGEANADEDTRNTLGALRRLLRRANPQAACIILAHARTGAKNIAQAVGYDAANFGKGSKALYSAARCVWNLAPGDETENPPLVAAHAKSNDAPRERPRALRLDAETMTYQHDPTFDLEAWQAGVNARASGRGGTRKAPALDSFHPVVLDVLKAGGPMPSGLLRERIGAEIVRRGQALGQGRIKSLVADCFKEGFVAKMERASAPGGSVLIGTPEQIDALRRPKLPLEEGNK